MDYPQHFRKLFSHIIYGDVKTRYNVFRKIEYDVFGARILQGKKAYFIRFFIILMRLKAHCRTEMMGLIGAGNNPMVGMTVAVAVAIEEASK